MTHLPLRLIAQGATILRPARCASLVRNGLRAPSLCLVFDNASAVDFHVATTGSDANSGTATEPLLSIAAAADLAQPGDTVIIHAGTYRERIAPPRGGTSEDRRITYRAAAGERVIVCGSEIVTGWKEVGDGTWRVVLQQKVDTLPIDAP